MYLNDVKIHKIGSISTLLRNVVNESDQTQKRPSGGSMREGRRKYTALLKGANFREAARWPDDPFQNFSRVSQSHHPGAAVAERPDTSLTFCNAKSLNCN